MLRLSKLSKLLGGNYEQIQARLRDIEPPCIPFIGAYLHEVAYIWDTYPALVTSEIVRPCTVRTARLRCADSLFVRGADRIRRTRRSQLSLGRHRRLMNGARRWPSPSPLC
jgi:hypothetical protein